MKRRKKCPPARVIAHQKQLRGARQRRHTKFSNRAPVNCVIVLHRHHPLGRRIPSTSLFFCVQPVGRTFPSGAYEFSPPQSAGSMAGVGFWRKVNFYDVFFKLGCVFFPLGFDWPSFWDLPVKFWGPASKHSRKSSACKKSVDNHVGKTRMSYEK